MPDEAAWLAALQHADSFFPAGAASFSWGVEALLADGHVRSAAELGQFVAAYFEHRWVRCDRAFLVWAHRAHRDLPSVAAIDCQADAMALPREQREGSARAGAALLSMHERLGTPGAAAYRTLVRGGHACGHLSVVQGLAWAGIGLDEALSGAAGAHGFAVSLVGAALRLGMITHLDAQRILTDLRPSIAVMLAAPPPDLGVVAGFTPMVDIAQMRHEMQAVRLFAN
jgi:urease accessory protein